jgi:hypothetical protein
MSMNFNISDSWRIVRTVDLLEREDGRSNRAELIPTISQQYGIHLVNFTFCQMGCEIYFNSTFFFLI